MQRRVLHVIPSLAPRDGGPSTAIIGMCRALSDAGTATLIAATDADGPGRLDVPLGVVENFKGIPTAFFPRQASESFKWSRPLAAWLDAHVSEFDLVHVHAVFSHSSIAAGRSCRRHGVPYIVRPLGSLDPWSLGRHSLRKTVLMRLATRQLLSEASVIHYTSDEERRLAEQALPWLPRGVVVPLGIETAVFEGVSEPASSSERYVLAMSRLHEKKGLELLLGAFHDVVGEASGTGSQDGWRLLIAGEGDAAYVRQLRAVASEGAARDRIVFTGWVAGPERRRCLRGASLFVLPSHQENFGIAMVEAMACGVPPLVGPGVNLSAEIESAGAGWVVPLQRADWHASLRSAMADDEGRERRALNAREFAGQFRWPAVAARMRSMYGDVSSGKS